MSLTNFAQASMEFGFLPTCKRTQQACFKLHPKHIKRDFFKHKTVKMNDKI